MTTLQQKRRAERDAAARAHAERVKTVKAQIGRQAANIMRHDLADPVGYSPTWEIASPNRQATSVSPSGYDPDKTPGTGDV